MSDKSAGDADLTRGTGLASLESAKQYWQKIMSGDRNANMAATAPAINAVNEGADAQRQEQANMGTGRGGGVNAANQQAATQTKSTIDNALLSAQPVAAQSVERIGTTETNVAGKQMTEALQALGLSAAEAEEIIQSSIQSRPTSMGANPLNAVSSIVLDKALASLGF